MNKSKSIERLDRLLAHATGLSRKQAGIEIRKQRVRVGEEIVRDPGRRVAAGADIYWREQLLEKPGKVYLMLHKPAGLVCARRDDRYATVLELLPDRLARRVHIVGRLDKETTGLLLLSDDGAWSHRITSPRHACPKRYLATLAEPLSEAAEERFAGGMSLRNEERPTRPAGLERVGERQARVTLQEGRYHQVRRMFAALGNHVEALHREAVGGLFLDPGLAPGEWRELTESERSGLVA